VGSFHQRRLWPLSCWLIFFVCLGRPSNNLDESRGVPWKSNLCKSASITAAAAERAADGGLAKCSNFHRLANEVWIHPFAGCCSSKSSSSRQVIIIYKAQGNVVTFSQMSFRSLGLVVGRCVVTGPPLKTAFII
jgi:hypothetical protein